MFYQYNKLDDIYTKKMILINSQLPFCLTSTFKAPLQVTQKYIIQTNSVLILSHFLL